MKKDKKPVGRPKNKEQTVIYFRRVKPDFVPKLDECLNNLKQKADAWKNAE